jgi:hypothetical protein
MKFFSILLTISLLAIVAVFPRNSEAKDVEGVHIEETFNHGISPLVLNGAGVRSKFFMDLYVASLYLPKTDSKVSDILDTDIIAIRLDIISSMITSKKMNDAIIEGFENAAGDKIDALAPQISAFMATFNKPISVGDQFIFVMEKNKGVSSLKNGLPQGDIRGEDFRRALINIWLGHEPAQESLKEAMLGIE